MNVSPLKNGLNYLLLLAGLLYSMPGFSGGNLLQINSADPSTHDSVFWQSSQIPITWYMSQDGLSGSTITNTELQAELQNAFDAWAGVTTSQVSFNYGGEINERYSGIDGKSLLTFSDDDYVFPAGELAFAITYTFVNDITIDATNNDLDLDGVADLPNGFYPAGAIYEADIVFNASHVYTSSGADSTVDIHAVAQHEIGHIIGLSHSVISGAVMHPFLSSDITSARTLKADDIAYASRLYPAEPAYSATFGSVSGVITNGFGGQRILGAHVYAVNPLTGNKKVGAYSLEQGDYIIPGLFPGDYYIGIEPLDGEPKEADPKRINLVIENTFDTNFSSEFYDANESSVETSANNAKIITVGAGNTVLNIDLITNTADVSGVGTLLKTGLNLFAFPVEAPTGYTAFDLFNAIGDEFEINSIDRYNTGTGRYERVYWLNGQPAGIDFAIERGEGYLVHMQLQKTVVFEGQQNCPLVNATRGFNLIGVPCPPAGYSAFDLLASIGPEALNVQRYNSDTENFEVASMAANGNPTGNDFAISNGTAYVVEMLADKTGVSLPGLQQIFPPFISSLSPGRGVIGTPVTIEGLGFSDDPVQNRVLFNGVPAAVNYASGGQLIVTVPGIATSGLVSIAIAGKISNAIEFEVESLLVNESDLQGKDMVDGQTVQGTLDTNLEQDRYDFIVSKGASITATALSVSPGVPDLLLFLEGPSGEVLTSDDDSGGGSNAKISRFEAPRTGRYSLVVTAKPGSGSGPYTLQLDIENTPPIAEITVLDGGFQTGLMGTVLPNALEILVTGSNGLPVSGVPVSILTNDADDIVVSSGFTGATFQVLTNSSGIATVNMILPNKPGEFDITIEIPPTYTPKTIKAATVATLPTQVKLINNNQDCGGSGCLVDQTLPLPYTLRFLDSNLQPVQGVIVNFSVVSGGGSLTVSSNAQEISRTSDAAGEVSVTHRLGTRVYDLKTGLRIPQLVAAAGSSPGAELMLFETKAKAGSASIIESLKTNSIQMTMGTGVLNAIQIKVTDSYGNPAANSPISYIAEGGLIVLPCEACTGGMSALETNADGFFTGILVADYQTEEKPIVHVNLGSQGFTAKVPVSGVSPTIDETGVRIPSTQPYLLQLFTGSASKTYSVNVDMGPSLVFVTSDGTDDSAWATLGESQWVGQMLDKTVATKIVAYNRADSCSFFEAGFWPATFPVESDDGLVTDESYDNIYLFEFVKGYETDVYWKIARNDGASDGAKVTPKADPMFANVQMGSARGELQIETKTDSKSFEVPQFSQQAFCIDAISGDPISYSDAADILRSDYPPIPVEVDGLVNHGTFNAVSPKITVSINDNVVVESDPDPLQIIRSNSGVDLTKLGIRLNGNDIFSGNLSMDTYPNFMQAKINGLGTAVLDSNIKGANTPTQFEFIYYPTASEIILSGANTIVITGIEDAVGNNSNNVQQIFTLP
ncbi:MAG: matrixin family metalloprotease [Methylococcales bacterium]